MSRVWGLAFLLIFTTLNLVHGYKLCKLEDTKCITKAAQMAFAQLLPGIKDVSEPLDPLHIAPMDEKSPALKYKLTNITITGLGDCLYSVAKFSPEESTYLSEFVCPKLVVRYIYKSKGYIGSVEIDGIGLATVTLNDYNMAVKVDYGTLISKKNNKHNLFITNYNTEFDAKGPVTVNIDGSLHNDPVKNALAMDFMYKNGKLLETLLRTIIMPKYIDSIVKAIDNYFRTYHVEDIFHEY